MNNNKYISLFAIVPTFIYQNKNLNGYDKLLAERITALCCKKGYSWVSNSYLAKMYGLRADVISKKIKKLEKEKFIICKYEKKEDSLKSKRVIYLHDNVWAKNTNAIDLTNNEKLVSINEHNINDKYKRNNKYNSIIDYDADGIMLWNGIKCESVDATEEEIKEMEDLLAPFNNDSERINYDSNSYF